MSLSTTSTRAVLTPSEARALLRAHIFHSGDADRAPCHLASEHYNHLAHDNGMRRALHPIPSMTAAVAGSGSPDAHIRHAFRRHSYPARPRRASEPLCNWDVAEVGKGENKRLLEHACRTSHRKKKRTPPGELPVFSEMAQNVIMLKTHISSPPRAPELPVGEILTAGCDDQPKVAKRHGRHKWARIVRLRRDEGYERSSRTCKLAYSRKMGRHGVVRPVLQREVREPWERRDALHPVRPQIKLVEDIEVRDGREHRVRELDGVPRAEVRIGEQACEMDPEALDVDGQPREEREELQHADGHDEREIDDTRACSEDAFDRLKVRRVRASPGDLQGHAAPSPRGTGSASRRMRAGLSYIVPGQEVVLEHGGRSTATAPSRIDPEVVMAIDVTRYTNLGIIQDSISSFLNICQKAAECVTLVRPGKSVTLLTLTERFNPVQSKIRVLLVKYIPPSTLPARDSQAVTEISGSKPQEGNWKESRDYPIPSRQAVSGTDRCEH
ncbi:hypothetical protein FB451DRAFT_1448402 [Mycena latifolia]|nr:hypothetical protein FB451DRAFT_1448402 [Mycena latifolia]